MDIQTGSSQDLRRISVDNLTRTIANFTPKSSESVIAAANEIAGRISRNEINQADNKSLRKKINSYPATINPGVDIVYAAFAQKETLDSLSSQIKNYQPGDTKRPVIAAANEIVRRSKEEPNNPDIELTLIEIEGFDPFSVNPGKEILEKYQLEKMDLKDLVSLITNPPENHENKSKSAAEELVRRDNEAAMQCKLLAVAFRNVFSVADQLEIPGIEILREHAGRRAELNN